KARSMRLTALCVKSLPFNCSRLEGAPGVLKSACFAEGYAGQCLQALKPILALPSRISVRPRRWRREIEAFCLQLVLNFLNGAIELLIFAFEFFPRIVVDEDIRIDSVPFDDQLFARVGANRTLRLNTLTA